MKDGVNYLSPNSTVYREEVIKRTIINQSNGEYVCCNKCAANSQCNAFTYGKRSDKACQLLRSLSRMGRVEQADVITGRTRKARVEQGDFITGRPSTRKAYNFLRLQKV